MYFQKLYLDLIEGKEKLLQCSQVVISPDIQSMLRVYSFRFSLHSLVCLEYSGSMIKTCDQGVTGLMYLLSPNEV